MNGITGTIARKIRDSLQSFGYNITRYGHLQGNAPLVDIKYFTRAQTHPVVFDVGANVGQSIKRFGNIFPSMEIHAFEPSPSTFKRLHSEFGNRDDCHLSNLAVGSKGGTMQFFENTHSDMSSFFKPSKTAWGELVTTTDVEVTTLDDYCISNQINHVHVLKTDTQGYDLEVLKGAESLLTRGAISLIYCELIFSEMYENMPHVDELFKFLRQHKYRLVSFYDQNYQNNSLSWTDALFISESILQKNNADLIR